MKKKLFVSINIPKALKKALSLTYQYQEVDVKWTKDENQHITVVFLGETDLNLLPDIIAVLRNTVNDLRSFDLDFTGIVPGPPNKKVPSMIWALFNSSEEYKELVNKISEGMHEVHPLFRSSRRDLIPHITLGKFNNVDTIDQIDFEAESQKKFSIIVDSITLVESELTSKGPVYTVMETFNFE